MLRFVAVHPVAFPEAKLQELANEPMPEGVTWDSTYNASADGRSFCHWKAPSMDAVIAIFTKYEIPYEAIHVVRRFDPATGVMEPEGAEEKIAAPA